MVRLLVVPLALLAAGPAQFRRLKAWVSARPFHLSATAGIALIGASALLPWFMGFPPPDLAAPFRDLHRIEIVDVPSLTPLAVPAAALLLALPAHRPLRALCLGLLGLNAPVWFLGGFFKGAPGLDVGSGVALLGLLLTYVAAGRLRDETPVVSASWPLRATAALVVATVGLIFLLPLQSFSFLSLGLGFLVGGLSYLAATVAEIRREGGSARDDN